MDRTEPSGMPPAVMQLVEVLSKLPGVGRKSALRMALYVLRAPHDYARSLAEAALAVKERIALCGSCGTLSETDPCPICADPRRDRRMVCVVEEPGDVIALERTGTWKGVYHVLGGAISPLDGVGPDRLRLEALRRRIADGGVREVVVATNPTSEGETTALFIARMLKDAGVRVTRIARGVPVGSDLELVDDTTLQRALEGRTELAAE